MPGEPLGDTDRLTSIGGEQGHPMRPTYRSRPGLGSDGAATDHSAGAEALATPPVYDSFVVRMWRTPETHQVRRIEIEHVQSGAISSAGDAAPEWILAQFDHGLGDPPPGRVPPPD